MVDKMQKYIENLKKKPQEELYWKSRAALIRTGVLNEDGSVKEQIVNRY